MIDIYALNLKSRALHNLYRTFHGQHVLYVVSRQNFPQHHVYKTKDQTCYIQKTQSHFPNHSRPTQSYILPTSKFLDPNRSKFPFPKTILSYSEPRSQCIVLLYNLQSEFRHKWLLCQRGCCDFEYHFLLLVDVNEWMSFGCSNEGHLYIRAFITIRSFSSI